MRLKNSIIDTYEPTSNLDICFSPDASNNDLFEIEVRFFQISTGLSQRTYQYYVKEKTYRYLEQELLRWIDHCENCEFKDKSKDATIKIMAQNCPTYKIIGYDNPVIITTTGKKVNIPSDRKIIEDGKLISTAVKREYYTKTFYNVIKDQEFWYEKVFSRYFTINQCYEIRYGLINFNKNKDNFKTINTEREDKMFENIFKNLKFGKVEDESIKMSIYGPAFATEDWDNFIAYDVNKKEYIDVNNFIFDFDGFCYQIPVAIKDVKVNDFILHNNKWVRVIELKENGKIEVEKIGQKEVATILPTKNIFGFDFYTKLITFGTDLFGANSASEDNPFGAMMLPMLMSENAGGNSKDFMNMWLIMNMQNSTNKSKEEDNDSNFVNNLFDVNNPLFLMMMLKN